MFVLDGDGDGSCNGTDFTPLSEACEVGLMLRVGIGRDGDLVGGGETSRCSDVRRFEAVTDDSVRTRFEARSPSNSSSLAMMAAGGVDVLEIGGSACTLDQSPIELHGHSQQTLLNRNGSS